VRLLDADGGLVYLRTSVRDELRTALSIGFEGYEQRSSFLRLRLRVGVGMFGKAVETRRVVTTGDYLTDDSFPHEPGPDRAIQTLGVRSMIVAPLLRSTRVMGALGVHTSRPHAFGEEDAVLVRALADHAASAIFNAELIAEMRDSRGRQRRRIEVERTLRELAAALTALSDPTEVLQRTVESAVTLLVADGSRIDLLEEREGRLYWGYDATAGEQPHDVPTDELSDASPDEGISGQAMRDRRPMWTADYVRDPRFPHSDVLDAWVQQRGVRSVLAAPILGEHGPLGTLTVYSGRIGEYDENDGQVLGALSEVAAIAVTNARLIAELRRSREELAERADTERALREINSDISMMREPTAILHRIAAEGARLLGTERVSINIPNDPEAKTGWTWYTPSDVGIDPWSAEDSIGIDEGICGLAITQRRTIITGDYLADTRFIHKPGPDRYTEEEGLPSAIAVPIFDADEPVGALLAESEVADAFDANDAQRLEALARQAGIALANARLVERLRGSEAQLRESEARYRYLVTASPDVVWEADLDGRLTFVSDAIERITGGSYRSALGRPFGDLVAPTSIDRWMAQLARVVADPAAVSVEHFDLIGRDGVAVPVENYATGMFRAGVIVGSHGAARDVSERERLERDLRRQASELAASAERAHLARELHDSVTQALFAMTLVSRGIEIQLERDPQAALARFAELRELQREALAEMRSLIFELRPGSIERDGLEKALQTHVAGVEGRVGLAVVLEFELDERLPLDVEEAFYRISQEALHNIVRHAHADQATIRVWRQAGMACLAVTDDGRGFDPSAVPAGHLGIAGMIARAERLGGTASVASTIGEGSRMEAEVPLASEEAAAREPARAPRLTRA
jgi:PAS domain S-box-containing protein